MSKIEFVVFTILLLGFVSAQDGYYPLCSSDDNCGNGNCVLNRCQCDSGYRSIIGQVACTTFDSNCTTAADCGGDSCINNLCSCNTNKIDGNSQCSVSMSCQPADTNKCSNNGMCQGSVCYCNPGYYSLKAPCDTQSSPCFKDSMCGNGKCNTTIGQCSCDAGWKFSSLTCDGCTGNSSCVNGYCNNNVCVCNSGWTIGSSYKCDTQINAVDTCDSKGFSNYCKNSGICTLTDQSKPTCSCPAQWYGDRCESENFCVDHYCSGVNETCVINANLTGAFCQNSNNICPACDAASSLTFSFVLALFINYIL